MAIIKKMLKGMSNVIKSRALKYVVPLITHMQEFPLSLSFRRVGLSGFV